MLNDNIFFAKRYCDLGTLTKQFYVTSGTKDNQIVRKFFLFVSNLNAADVFGLCWAHFIDGR